MKVIIRNPQRKELQVEGRRRAGQLLRELGLNPEYHIVMRGGELLTRDDLIEGNDTVEILSAISGG